MTNYYVVFVGRKHGVCNSWIECQRRVILYKESLYKAYTSKDIATQVLYLPGWKTPDGSGVGISSLTPNCGHEDKKQMENRSSATYICHIIRVIIALMYVIVIE